MKLSGIEVATFLMPGDKVNAQRALGGMLAPAREAWLAMYGFTNAEFGRLIETLDLGGTVWHMLLDASQYVGHTEHPFVDALAKQLQHADITLACAGPGSPKPHIIMHMKTIVARYDDGSYGVWEGSVNFSGGGWDQGNTAMLFRSPEFATQQFIPWFNANRDWSLAHVPQRNLGVERIKLGLMKMGVSFDEQGAWEAEQETK